MITGQLRRLAIALVTGAVALLIAVDVLAPTFNPVDEGSVAMAPRAEQLVELPPELDCEQNCAHRYAFSTDKTLLVVFSVRNEWPLPITLLGIPDEWFPNFPALALGRPVRALSGTGDPRFGTTSAMDLVPFQPISLGSGEQWFVGVEFRTEASLDRACEYWSEGSAIEWSQAPVAWRWLFTEHRSEVTFQPVAFMAPNAADCTWGARRAPDMGSEALSCTRSWSRS
jgi:hypothetical protein